MIGIYLFRRDLRLHDNRGLTTLAAISDIIYPVFIMTPEQVDNNKYASAAAIGFMADALGSLNDEIGSTGLNIYHGDNIAVLEKLIIAAIKITPNYAVKKTLKNVTDTKGYIDTSNISSNVVVCFAVDYSPYARERDASIIALCKRLGAAVIFEYDYYLFPPKFILNKSGETYRKFTPYATTAIEYLSDRKNRSQFAPALANKFKFARFEDPKPLAIIDVQKYLIFKYNIRENDIRTRGTRTAALELLAGLARRIHKYSHNDYGGSCAVDTCGSTLSPYIKFGLLSIREVYNVGRKNPDFVRQLLWREFYAGIIWSYPYVIGRAMNSRMDAMKWPGTREHFNKWCSGTTGYPIVDAAMRELVAVGRISNRLRLIVAEMLVKILLIDWQAGERFFAAHLIDYDISNNNGNWQWVAGTGTDSQPYFRVLNPWRQSREHDPNAEYILQWVPELIPVSADDIHNWYDPAVRKKYTPKQVQGYPAPIVDYEQQYARAIDFYSKYK